MQEKTNKPSIRFKGFTDAWEQRKLNEICSYTSSSLAANNALENGKYPLYDANSQIGFVDTFHMKDSYITVIKDGAGVGRIRVLPKNTAFIGTMGALTNTDSELYFLFCLLEKKDLSKQFTGSTIPHIYFKDYGNDSILIPGTGEQKRIAEFFSRLDTFITLHQRKCETLKSLKKAMLEKLFPAEGSTVPEIRFKGFTDAWEQRKVCEIANRYDNLRIPVAENLRKSGSVPYYGANGIQDYVDGYTHDGEYVLIAEDGANDLKNYPVQYVFGKIWVNNHAHVLQGIINKLDNQFLSYLLHSVAMEPLLVGGGRAKLNADVLMNIEVQLPSIHEQHQIGEYLAKIDNLITLHQRKVEKLKNIKNSLLEKMFV